MINLLNSFRSGLGTASLNREPIHRHESDMGMTGVPEENRYVFTDLHVHLSRQAGNNGEAIKGFFAARQYALHILQVIS